MKEIEFKLNIPTQELKTDNSKVRIVGSDYADRYKAIEAEHEANQEDENNFLKNTLFI